MITAQTTKPRKEKEFRGFATFWREAGSTDQRRLKLNPLQGSKAAGCLGLGMDLVLMAIKSHWKLGLALPLFSPIFSTEASF